jgi:hypothetical protein
LIDGCIRSVRQRQPGWVAFVALALAGLLASVVLGACGANVDLRVDVAPSGSGSVTLTVAFPANTAAQIEDLKNGLPVTDLRAAGWVVDGPRSEPGGTTVVSASHDFSELSQVPALVADIAGSGPQADRPFRLTVNEVPGYLENTYTASGRVDLQCSLSCFDDPKLAASVGYALGMPASEVHQLIADPAKEIDFRVEVLLPGQVTGSDATVAADGGHPLSWSPVLGTTTPVSESTKVVDKGRVEALGIAVAAGAFVVLVTAVFVIVTGRRHRHRYRGGLRFR